MDEKRRALHGALFALLFTVWGWLKWSGHAFWGAGQEWLDYPLGPALWGAALTPGFLILAGAVVLPPVLAPRLASRASTMAAIRCCRGALVILNGSAILMVAASGWLALDADRSLDLSAIALYALLILPVPLIVSAALWRCLSRLHAAARAASASG